MAARRRKRAIKIAILIVAISVIGWLAGSFPGIFGPGINGYIVMLVLLIIVPPVLEIFFNRELKKTKRAIRGAKGEEKIGAILDTMNGDNMVIHDIADPNGNIDHVVISREHGIITIETKSHGGKVTISDGSLLVNGRSAEKDFFGQSLRNAYWLRNNISATIGIQPWISQIIVFSNAFVTASKPFKGIRVVNKKYLIKTIETFKGDTNNELIWSLRDDIYNKLKQT